MKPEELTSWLDCGNLERQRTGGILEIAESKGEILENTGRTTDLLGVNAMPCIGSERGSSRTLS